MISVGNLTLGGTGKTPMVEWLARRLRAENRRVAILSRGYGGTAGLNDEGRVLEENLPDVPHLQDADRVNLAQDRRRGTRERDPGAGRRVSAPPAGPGSGYRAPGCARAVWARAGCFRAACFASR